MCEWAQVAYSYYDFSEAMTIDVLTIEAITIQAITEFATVAMNSISHAMAPALMTRECSVQEAS